MNIGNSETENNDLPQLINIYSAIIKACKDQRNAALRKKIPEWKGTSLSTCSNFLPKASWSWNYCGKALKVNDQHSGLFIKVFQWSGLKAFKKQTKNTYGRHYISQWVQIEARIKIIFLHTAHTESLEVCK